MSLQAHKRIQVSVPVAKSEYFHDLQNLRDPEDRVRFFSLLISTRSYAALRAADLDWIVRPGHSWGKYIWRKTMKNHENQPGTMKNQPETMKNHENRPGTIRKTDLEQ